MTRLGWSILALVILTIAGFASLLSFGAAPVQRTDREVAVPVADDLLVVPVKGYPRAALVDSWGDARGGGARGHHGTDIIAPTGTPVIAAAAGRVEKLFESRLGGTTLYQRSADGRWMFYYAHLARYADGVREGMAVRAGQTLAYVGDTGDAGPGNYHLHFGLAHMAPGARWWEGEDVDPYPILARGRAIR